MDTSEWTSPCVLERPADAEDLEEREGIEGIDGGAGVAEVGGQEGDDDDDEGGGDAWGMMSLDAMRGGALCFVTGGAYLLTRVIFSEKERKRKSICSTLRRD